MDAVDIGIYNKPGGPNVPKLTSTIMHHKIASNNVSNLSFNIVQIINLANKFQHTDIIKLKFQQKNLAYIFLFAQRLAIYPSSTG